MITDGRGNIQTFLYKYQLHDQNHQLIPTSSGILINPSIHTSTSYAPGGDDNRRWLEATPFTTLSPQNSPYGSPVHYSEIEEILLDGSGSVNGKKIYYFEKMYVAPAANYIYLNYELYGGRGNHLISLQNTLFGKQNYYLPELAGLSTSNFTYMAYPVGSFTISRLMEGKLLKEVTLNANGVMVKKVENEYTGGFGVEKTQFGLIVKEFIDGENRKRYLIAQTNIQFGIRELVKRVTSHFYLDESITEIKSFVYNNLNLPQSTSITSSAGKQLVEEYVYANDIVFQASGNLSGQAASINRMKELNMTGIPLQITIKNGNEYSGGTYSTYKQLPSGHIVIDSVFSLEPLAGNTILKPFVNTKGLVIKNSSFIPDKAFLSYDSNIKPSTVAGKDGVKETIVWGYAGQHPIAGITNYTDNQLRNNSVVVNQLALLGNFTAISESDRPVLSDCNQAIRSNLPSDVLVSTFTYSPHIGITSATDHTGKTTYYEYDTFRRIQYVKDHNGKIIEQYDYHYKQ